MTPTSLTAFWRLLPSAVLGIVVGTIGSFVHRAYEPWGLVLALAIVLAASTAMRAWAGAIPVLGVLGGLMFAIVLFSQRGPGGDVLIPSGDWLGWGWIIGSFVAGTAALAWPRRWFTDDEAGPTGIAGPTA